MINHSACPFILSYQTKEYQDMSKQAKSWLQDHSCCRIAFISCCFWQSACVFSAFIFSRNSARNSFEWNRRNEVILYDVCWKLISQKSRIYTLVTFFCFDVIEGRKCTFTSHSNLLESLCQISNINKVIFFNRKKIWDVFSTYCFNSDITPNHDLHKPSFRTLAIMPTELLVLHVSVAR